MPTFPLPHFLSDNALEFASLTSADDEGYAGPPLQRILVGNESEVRDNVLPTRMQMRMTYSLPPSTQLCLSSGFEATQAWHFLNPSFIKIIEIV
jgi:hypothetical protein